MGSMKRNSWILSTVCIYGFGNRNLGFPSTIMVMF